MHDTTPPVKRKRTSFETLLTDEIKDGDLQEKHILSSVDKKILMGTLNPYDVTPAPVARPELDVTYVLATDGPSVKVPDVPANHVFDLLDWSAEPVLPYELLERKFIPHLVVVGSPLAALVFYNLLNSQYGIEIRDLEFLVLQNIQDTKSLIDRKEAQEKFEASLLVEWASGSSSIKIIRSNTTVMRQVERHARFIQKHNGIRTIRGFTDANRTKIDPKTDQQLTLMEQEEAKEKKEKILPAAEGGL